MNQQAQQIELVAEKRAVTGKQVRELRRQGLVPGVMYGHGFNPVHLQFDARTLGRLLSHVTGSQLVSVKFADQEQSEIALVRDVQRDPIKGTLLHVDFYRVEMTERLRTEIQLVLDGESPVAERGEGIILQGITALEVECLPTALVDAIAVDLTDLVELDQAIYVRDLAVPAGIDILSDLDELVVRVMPLAEEEILEELEELPEVEIEEVELVTAKREEGEEKEGEEE